MARGEIVEDVESPLPLTTPLLLVKPPVGLSTPAVFRALDLARRSTADPLELLRGLAAKGATEPELCVNDLEQPAFDVLPSLAQLKQRLISESDGRFSAVFMTGVSAAAFGTPPCCFVIQVECLLQEREGIYIIPANSGLIRCCKRCCLHSDSSACLSCS